MSSVLVVGATRGLGLELVKQYATKDSTIVTGTARSKPSKDVPNTINWLTGIDVAEECAGGKIAEGLKGRKQDIVIISAGVFLKESYDEPDFAAQVTMYKTSAIGPIFIVQALEKAGVLAAGSKVILVSSEAGSITLRHESEGGGMYGHHASKAALNMVGRLLSFDLKDKGVAVGLVHPAFMRTEMVGDCTCLEKNHESRRANAVQTKGVGFDKFWDDGGAVTPDVSAGSLVEWIDGFDIRGTGEYWAPRGAGDIGTAEPVLGKKKTELPTPLQLPW